MSRMQLNHHEELLISKENALIGIVECPLVPADGHACGHDFFPRSMIIIIIVINRHLTVMMC